MTRFFTLILAGLTLASLTQPAAASTYEITHPACLTAAQYQQANGTPAPAGYKPVPCVRIQIYLYDSKGTNLEWTDIWGKIDANTCAVTVDPNSPPRYIEGQTHLHVDGTHWYNVGRAWHMPKGCPVLVHATHVAPWYTPNDSYTFRFDSTVTQKDVCYRLKWVEEVQGYCSSTPQ